MSASVAGPGGDIFLNAQAKTSGKLKGECVEPGHEGDIQLIRWSWGMQQSSALGSTAATGRRAFRQLVVEKHADTATTGLLNTMRTNDEIKSAEIVMRRSGGEQYDYLKLKIEKGRIASIDIDTDPAGRVVEKICFVFRKVEVNYMLQQTTGHKGASSSYVDEMEDS